MLIKNFLVNKEVKNLSKFLENKIDEKYKKIVELYKFNPTIKVSEEKDRKNYYSLVIADFTDTDEEFIKEAKKTAKSTDDLAKVFLNNEIVEYKFDEDEKYEFYKLLNESLNKKLIINVAFEILIGSTRLNKDGSDYKVSKANFEDHYTYIDLKVIDDFISNIQDETLVDNFVFDKRLLISLKLMLSNMPEKINSIEILKNNIFYHYTIMSNYHILLREDAWHVKPYALPYG